MQNRPPATMAKCFGERLHQLRRSAGMNQEQLSDLIKRANNNCSSRLERGAAGSICFDVLEELIKLAEGQGKDANWLLTGREARPKTDKAEGMDEAQMRRILREELQNIKNRYSHSSKRIAS